jgi:hypothetical protein
VERLVQRESVGAAHGPGRPVGDLAVGVVGTNSPVSAEQNSLYPWCRPTS